MHPALLLRRAGQAGQLGAPIEATVHDGKASANEPQYGLPYYPNSSGYEFVKLDNGQKGVIYVNKEVLALALKQGKAAQDAKPPVPGTPPPPPPPGDLPEAPAPPVAFLDSTAGKVLIGVGITVGLVALGQATKVL